MATVRAFEHGGRVIGKIGPEDKRIESLGPGRGLQAASSEGVRERAVDRHLDRNIPVGRTAFARVTTAVISVNAEGTYTHLIHCYRSAYRLH